MDCHTKATDKENHMQSKGMFVDHHHSVLGEQHTQ
jgi:hypothetical protein